MLKFLRSLASVAKPEALRPEPPQEKAPDRVLAPGVADFDLSAHWLVGQGLPLLDWDAVRIWIDAIEQPEARAKAWADCELAWLGHLRLALGGSYRIQAFWSGQAFSQPDEGQAMAYDLARILVSQLGADWPRFQTFARAASASDGGHAAAQTCLGVGLDELVCALLEKQSSPQWAPDRARWLAPRSYAGLPSEHLLS